MDAASGHGDGRVAEEEAVMEIEEKAAVAKRTRDDLGETAEVEEGGEGVTMKKPKLDGAVTEGDVSAEIETQGDAALNVEAEAQVEDEEKLALAKGKEAAPAKGEAVTLGPKTFKSSVEIFEYFFSLLHAWSFNLDINKYEQLVLLDLLKKGHVESDRKIGAGIEAFEIRNHPVWRSRCFFIRRVDGSAEDFSFRKCIDNILPLPENLRLTSGSHGGRSSNGKGRRGGGGGGFGGRGGGRGRGRRNA